MDIRKLPAVVGGASLHPVETATTVRVQDGQTLVTDGPFADTKEIFGRLLPGRGRRPGPGDRDRGADPGRQDRRLGGDPAGRHRPRVTGAGTDRADLPRRVGPGAGLPDRLLRRFRPGRGGHRGGVRGRGAALAGRRDAGQSRRLAGHHGPAPGHRPAAPRPRAGREAPPARRSEPQEAEDAMDGPPIPDERLELVFMCCHPALAIEAQVALTLRAVAGLTTEEIARAFLVPAETMKRAADPRQVQDQGGRHPVRRPGRVAAAGAARRGARRRLPHLQRGLQPREPAGETAWPPRRSGSAGCWPRCSRPSRRCSGCWR